ncbi:MAG: EthD family reductase [Sphingomonadales bacterium]|nr:MAG: EthD family reductase [Sphingomonadales bacterium]
MFKLIFLLTKKAGMSDADFFDYYETTHREFITRLPNVANYLRRYVKPLPGAAEDRPFDAITEVWFESDATYREAMKVAMTPEFQRDVAADEEHFVDRTRTKMFTVDERSW